MFDHIFGNVIQPMPSKVDVDTAGLNPDNIPRHIAIIMDGNGRWAKAQGKCARTVTRPAPKP